MATTEQLLNLDGIGLRQSTWRFDVLDAALTYQGEIKPTGDVTIGNDSTAAIQRTTSIALLEAPDFDVARARIRPQMVLENGAVLSCGTFMFTDTPRQRNSKGTVWTGALMDLGFLVDQESLGAFAVQTGQMVATTIEAILDQQGITDYLVDSTGVPVGRAIGWPPGTSWLAIVNQLAGIAGCLPLYFEADGRARVRATPNLATDPIDVTYVAGRNIFDTVIGESDNFLTAPNLFRAIDTGANSSPIIGDYEVPASAPNSAFNLGRVIPSVITEQGLPSSSAAYERARLESITNGAVIEGRSFDGPPDPRHGTYSIVLFEGVRYLERSWSMICREGQNMQHQLTRVYS